MGGRISLAVDKLKPLFNPRSIAFVGASSDPEKWGFIILSNLLRGGFPGRIYPVNPRQKEILGLPVYPSIAEVSEIPDLAVIVVPPSALPQVIKDCLDKGIKAGLLITAGLAELGGQGEQLQEEIVHLARQGGMVLQGPNCNGMMNPHHKFYCTMPTICPLPGPFAVIAQSGNVAGSVTRDIMSRGLGISHYISSGNEADLHHEDYLEYLGEDETTRVILSYVEGFRDGRRFLEVSRKVAKKKPIVMLKSGDTLAGAMAAKSHTASLAGSDSVANAAFRQAGIIRVTHLDEIVDIGSVFISQPLPKGNSIAILTGGGGWGGSGC
ncbi:acetate--CoA ligase family protein [Chloroflexota bacterium]